MNIFVCIKQVPDTETKIKLNADSSGVDTTGVKWIMSPYDELAVEEALRLSGVLGNIGGPHLPPMLLEMPLQRFARAVEAAAIPELRDAVERVGQRGGRSEPEDAAQQEPEQAANPVRWA